MAVPDYEVKNSSVVCLSSQGNEVRANLLRLTRFAVAFEVYNASLTLRMSEVLSEFRIVVQERTVYTGRAVICGLVNTGPNLVCDASLDEASWTDVEFTPAMVESGQLQKRFVDFLQEWQKVYRVLPDYKHVVADMQNFLAELRLWLNQIELGIRSSPSINRVQMERRAVEVLAKPIVGALDAFVERFESIAETLQPELEPAHRAYLRRQLHPFVLCSPFAYRAFHKPLGYAGDYELVNMMMRTPGEGGSLFAKVLNVWLLGQAPAQAHRNRVDYLANKLVLEALRLKSLGRSVRAYSLGCGPAAEIQKLLGEQPLADSMQFTLLDFNHETLVHVRSTLENLKLRYSRTTSIQFIKRSVQDVLKEGSKLLSRPPASQYDVIYCAGLFDYLSEAVCKRLMNVFYNMLAPGALLIATNVSDVMNRSHPFRYSMEYLLDWQLIYRDGPQIRALAPDSAPLESCNIIGEGTGTNIFIKVRKPEHA